MFVCWGHCYPEYLRVVCVFAWYLCVNVYFVCILEVWGEWTESRPLSPILGERAPAECLQRADPLQYTNTDTDTIHKYKYGYKYRHKYRYQKLSASRELNNTLHFIKHTIHSADSIFIISEKALNSNVHLIRYTSCPSHHIQKTHRALPSYNIFHIQKYRYYNIQIQIL